MVPTGGHEAVLPQTTQRPLITWVEVLLIVILDNSGLIAKLNAFVLIAPWSGLSHEVTA